MIVPVRPRPKPEPVSPHVARRFLHVLGIKAVWIMRDDHYLLSVYEAEMVPLVVSGELLVSSYTALTTIARAVANRRYGKTEWTFRNLYVVDPGIDGDVVFTETPTGRRREWEWFDRISVHRAISGGSP